VVEVAVTDEFRAWYEDLGLEEQESMFRAVTRLEQLGVSLGYPHSSSVEGSDYALRELRVQHQGRPYRVFYAFDPDRQAVLLIGGDKTGRDRFYEEMVPKAEGLWQAYMTERRER